MNLNFKLTDNLILKLDLNDKEEIWYCIPFDLYEDAYVSDSFIVVTDQSITVLKEGELFFKESLKKCKDIVCENLVCNAVLRIYLKNNKSQIIARCSMKHIVRLSYVARGAAMLINGIKHRVKSMEYEQTCPICGTLLNGTKICPNCVGRKSSIKKTIMLCKPFAGRFLIISLITILSSALGILSPKVTQVFVDNSLVNKNGMLRDVSVFILLMLGIALFNILFTTLRNILSTYLGSYMSRNLRTRMFAKVQQLALARIEDMKPGQLMNRITSDTTEIRQFMENTFAGTLSMLMTMIAALIYMLAIDWKMTLISLACAPVFFGLSYTMRNVFGRMFRQERSRHDVLNTRLQDVISGISIVKSFGQEKSEVSEFKELNKEYTEVRIRNNICFSIIFPLMSFVVSIGIYLITYSAGISVLKGGMTVGVLMQMISYANMLYSPLDFITRLPKEFASLLNNVERIYDVIEEDDGDFRDSEEIEKEITGDIEFSDVCFGYKSYEPILNNINLHIKPGEMIGLVGPSGTGKSTMINLIMNLYKVDSGVLTIDGIDINKLSKNSLRNQIGVVLQETFLFNGSIIDNIKFSHQEASFEEIIYAAKMANAHDFIVRTPDGYNTNVGERGYTLSGGERQRIAIARAILNKPKILILDEATSNLDTESEFLIQKALERLEKKCTTIAIAHRLSTLKNADRLVVIGNHQIIEEGSHEALLKKKGMYYNLVMAQLEMAKVE